MWINVNFDEPNKVFQSGFFTFALLLKIYMKRIAPNPALLFYKTMTNYALSSCDALFFSF